MSDWRSRMKQMLARAGGGGRRGVTVEEARQKVSEFLQATVLPAFEELKQELESHGRQVVIDQGRHEAGLTVFHQGVEEFSFAVRGRIYHKLSFAFPEVGSEKEPRVTRAEVVLSGGRVHGHEVRAYSKEAIIDEFLDEYAKWMGWTAQEKPPQA